MVDSVFAPLGVAGMVAAVVWWVLQKFISGEFVTKATLDREIERGNRYERIIYDRVLPLLDKNVDILKADKS